MIQDAEKKERYNGLGSVTSKIQDAEKTTIKPAVKKEIIRELTEKYRNKYARLSCKKAQEALLTQYCEITGYTRKYAQKLLSGKRDGSGEGRRKNKGRPRKYTEEDKRIIRTVWDKTGYWSGRRLKSALRLWLESWNNDKRREQLGEEQKQRICGISAAQIDRFIREYRQSKPREKNWRIGHSVDAVKGLIEQRCERWDVHEPGWLEADCVALCGRDMRGALPQTCRSPRRNIILTLH